MVFFFLPIINGNTQYSSAFTVIYWCLKLDLFWVLKTIYEISCFIATWILHNLNPVPFKQVRFLSKALDCWMEGGFRITNVHTCYLLCGYKFYSSWFKDVVWMKCFCDMSGCSKIWEMSGQLHVVFISQQVDVSEEKSYLLKM
jgi:hypothetical protein